MSYVTVKKRNHSQLLTMQPAATDGATYNTVSVTNEHVQMNTWTCSFVKSMPTFSTSSLKHIR